ncbi:MAG: LysR family transcriptional regulator [Pikeienuella sp.]|uniref:LysR family transcriptional regulator n=1 Tax=Pikeienuella sp. TaxID=2831957 RepID=UPI00391A55DF
MQIELVETFLDLWETRSFNRTAERLSVTQSTVSARIRALEARLERRLFTRSRSGTEPTIAGLRFEPHARALRRAWTEATNAAREAEAASLTLRIGVQHDLAAARVGEWVTALRAALPDASVYVEADFSQQMCADLISGGLDLAVIFTPRPHPDLHFETLGEAAYRMVTTGEATLEAVEPDRYILSNVSPAFARAHAALHPTLSAAQLSAGQSTVIAGMLAALGGAAYLPAEMAAAMAANGTARLVRRAPVIEQSVYAAVHLRNRRRAPHRRMVALLRETLLARG